jgi:hypothetical protein
MKMPFSVQITLKIGYFCEHFFLRVFNSSIALLSSITPLPRLELSSITPGVIEDKTGYMAKRLGLVSECLGHNH